jgi:hypothetical protein
MLSQMHTLKSLEREDDLCKELVRKWKKPIIYFKIFFQHFAGEYKVQVASGENVGKRALHPLLPISMHVSFAKFFWFILQRYQYIDYIVSSDGISDK